MSDDLLLQSAASVRRGVIRLGRRLQAERPERSEPLLRLAVLGHLSRDGALSPGTLAAAERLQPQSLTRTLYGLERDGLVSRQTDPVDRRRSLLALTEAGAEALRRDMYRRDGWLARAMAEELNPTERELLRLAGELMERLAESAVARGTAAGSRQGSGESPGLSARENAGHGAMGALENAAQSPAETELSATFT
jgi:DNA-binding MarR family transcriptional regulator